MKTIGGETIPIEGTLYPWNEVNANLVKDESATYALFHDKKIIFIGKLRS